MQIKKFQIKVLLEIETFSKALDVWLSWRKRSKVFIDFGSANASVIVYFDFLFYRFWTSRRENDKWSSKKRHCRSFAVFNGVFEQPMHERRSMQARSCDRAWIQVCLYL